MKIVFGGTTVEVPDAVAESADRLAMFQKTASVCQATDIFNTQKYLDNMPLLADALRVVVFVASNTNTTRHYNVLTSDTPVMKDAVKMIRDVALERQTTTMEVGSIVCAISIFLGMGNEVQRFIVGVLAYLHGAEAAIAVLKKDES